jgi:hypothetical protein
MRSFRWLLLRVHMPGNDLDKTAPSVCKLCRQTELT